MNNWQGKIAGGLLALPLLTGAALLQAQADYAEVRRDVEVMSRALQAASGSSGQGEAGLASVEGSYLAGQGIVLRLYGHGLGGHGMFHMGHNMDFQAFGEDIGAFVENIVSEVEMNLEGLGETLADISPGEPMRHRIVIADDTDMDMDMDMDVDFDEISEWISQQSRELEQQLREMRKAQSAARRELSAARREYERRMEEYEERLESGEDEAQARSSYEQAEAAMAEARRQYQEGRRAYEQKREVIRAERQAERQRRIAVLASDTLDNFCRYGTSLRSLPADERITLVFDGMGGDGSGDQDLFYVVSKQDFSACLAGDIEGDELMQRADSYSF